jgi:hypothetical protein
VGKQAWENDSKKLYFSIITSLALPQINVLFLAELVVCLVKIFKVFWRLSPFKLTLLVFAQAEETIELIPYGCSLKRNAGIMARRERNSGTLARAERRFESLRSISATLDFGNGLTLEAYHHLSEQLLDKRIMLRRFNPCLYNPQHFWHISNQ